MLSRIAAFSGLYDAVVGALLLCAPGWLATAFGVPPATPRIFSDLNGLFLLAVGAGYYLPWREAERYRGYLWVMGVCLKGAGAAIFLLDYVVRKSPRSFLLFAASDGLLAGLTLYALLSSAPAAPGPEHVTYRPRPDRVRRGGGRTRNTRAGRRG